MNFLFMQRLNASKFRYSVKYIRLADLDYETEDDDAHVSQFDVNEIFVHPNWKRQSYYNDIALIRMNGKAEFNQYIQPACLPQWDTVMSEKVVATGWGATSSSSIRRSNLQKVPLNLVSFHDCKLTYPANRKVLNGLLNRTQFCAGSKTGERDTCVVRLPF